MIPDVTNYTLLKVFDLWSEMMKNKLLILTSGDKAIRFRPHLNIGKKEIDHAMEIINISIENCLK